jgi:hypothetical protein
VAKKLRLSEAQAKKLVQELRLRLLPYDSSFLDPQTVLQIESLSDLIGYRDSETIQIAERALT